MTGKEFDQLYEWFVPEQNKEEMWELIQVLNEIKPVHTCEIGLSYGGAARIWAGLSEENYGRFIGVDKNPFRARCMLSLMKCPNYFVQGNCVDENVIDYTKRLIEETPERQFDFIFLDVHLSIKDKIKCINEYKNLLRTGGIFATKLYDNDTVLLDNSIVGSNHIYQENSFVSSSNLGIKYFIKK